MAEGSDHAKEPIVVQSKRSLSRSSGKTDQCLLRAEPISMEVFRLGEGKVAGRCAPDGIGKPRLNPPDSDQAITQERTDGNPLAPCGHGC